MSPTATNSLNPGPNLTSCLLTDRRRLDPDRRLGMPPHRRADQWAKPGLRPRRPRLSPCSMHVRQRQGPCGVPWLLRGLDFLFQRSPGPSLGSHPRCVSTVPTRTLAGVGPTGARRPGSVGRLRRRDWDRPSCARPWCRDALFFGCSRSQASSSGTPGRGVFRISRSMLLGTGIRQRSSLRARQPTSTCRSVRPSEQDPATCSPPGRPGSREARVRCSVGRSRTSCPVIVAVAREWLAPAELRAGMWL